MSPVTGLGSLPPSVFHLMVFVLLVQRMERSSV